MRLRHKSWAEELLANNRNLALNKEDIEQGDIIQLSFDGNNFAHSLFVVDKVLSNIWIATHTFDAYYKNLNDYNYQKIRFLHIEGIRKLS